MYSSEKIHDLTIIDNEQNSSFSCDCILPDTLSQSAYTAFCTHQLFLKHGLASEKSTSSISKNITGTFQGSESETIAKTAMPHIAKKEHFSLFSYLKRLFSPLSSLFSTLLPFDTSNHKLFAQWTHQEMEHSIIIDIARAMQESNKKIEEESRDQSKKKTILQEEIRKYTLRKERLQFELRHNLLS